MYSWIFVAILCLLAIGANFVSGSESLHLPWSTPNLSYWMYGLAVLGLLLVFMAISGTLRALLFLFTLYVVYLLVSGFFLNAAYVFRGTADARNTALLVLGAMVAAIGAWPFGGRDRRRSLGGRR